MIHPKSVITLAAIAAFPTLIIFTNGNLFKPKNGTVLKIESKANGFFNYDNVSWTLGKFKEPGSAPIKIGQSADFNYSISEAKHQVPLRAKRRFWPGMYNKHRQSNGKWFKNNKPDSVQNQWIL